MKTEVTTQKVVTVGMTLEEWVNELVDPKAFLVKIENATLAVVESDGNGKEHRAIKPARRPKGKTARAAGTAKGSKILVCPVCEKEFKTQGRYERHMERNHTIAAAPAAG